MFVNTRHHSTWAFSFSTLSVSIFVVGWSGDYTIYVDDEGIYLMHFGNLLTNRFFIVFSSFFIQRTVRLHFDFYNERMWGLRISRFSKYHHRSPYYLVYVFHSLCCILHVTYDDTIMYPIHSNFEYVIFGRQFAIADLLTVTSIFLLLLHAFLQFFLFLFLCFYFSHFSVLFTISPELKETKQ